MKITRETPQHLILEYQDRLAPVFLTAAALLPIYYSLAWLWDGDIFMAAVVACGAVILLFLAAMSLDRSQLIFDRQKAELTYRRKGGFYFHEHCIPLHNIKEYTLSPQPVEFGKQEFLPALLLHCDGDLLMEHLTERPSTEKDQMEIADRVNAWLKAARVDSVGQST